MQHQSLDLASYIAALPPQIKFDVFSSPWTTQALFRALSPLAQQYILRLLYVDDGVSKGETQQLAKVVTLPFALWFTPTATAAAVAAASAVDANVDSMRLWVVPGAESQHHNAVNQLEVLSVLAPDSRPGWVCCTCLTQQPAGHSLQQQQKQQQVKHIQLAGLTMRSVFLQDCYAASSVQGMSTVSPFWQVRRPAATAVCCRCSGGLVARLTAVLVTEQ
jgi:hypothetical protein